MSAFSHIPVMADEVMSLISPWRGGIYVDGTLGGGGHSSLLLESVPDGSLVVGIDRDDEAIAAASARLRPFGSKFIAVRGNFFDMKELLSGINVASVDGILLDLGVSSYQLDAAERGFSYNETAPLDMRMDRRSALTAADVVNTYSREELTRILREFGEERYAAKIASAMVREREKAPISTTTELAELVKRAMPAAARREAQHPARRTFQALRIEVNGELDGLAKALRDCESILKPGGVLAVITFHSLEDRIVKQTFRTFENPCICDPKAPCCTCGLTATAKVITQKPTVPSDAEAESNPRSRSAKLRAIMKL